MLKTQKRSFVAYISVENSVIDDEENYGTLLTTTISGVLIDLRSRKVFRSVSHSLNGVEYLENCKCFHLEYFAKEDYLVLITNFNTIYIDNMFYLTTSKVRARHSTTTSKVNLTEDRVLKDQFERRVITNDSIKSVKCSSEINMYNCKIGESEDYWMFELKTRSWIKKLSIPINARNILHQFKDPNNLFFHQDQEERMTLANKS